MNINNISQFKIYYELLPWYKRVFIFPWKLSSQLIKSVINDNDNDICNVYIQIYASSFWPFYNWFFPELESFYQSEVMVDFRGIARSTCQPPEDLLFSDLGVTLHSPLRADERTLRETYLLLNIAQPNQAICKYVRPYIPYIPFCFDEIKEWPLAFQKLESAGLLTPFQSSNLSDRQEALLRIVLYSLWPLNAALFIIKLNEMSVLTHDNIAAAENYYGLFPVNILNEIDDELKNNSIDKCIFINFLLKKIRSINDANGVIPLSNLLKKMCDFEQSFDLILNKMVSIDTPLRLASLLHKLEKKYESDRFKNDFISTNRLLFSSYQSEFIFNIILNTPQEKADEIWGLMEKLCHITTLTDEQKIEFYSYWTGFFHGLYLDEFCPPQKKIRHIENCILLFSRLDLVTNPSNLNAIMFDSDRLFIIRRILDFLSEFSYRTDANLVQSDFEALRRTNTFEQMIDYLKEHLDVVEHENCVTTLKYEQLFREISIRKVFGHFTLYDIEQFKEENKLSQTPSYWLSFMQSFALLADSPLINNVSEYEDRDQLVTIMLDLIKEGAQPYIAYTVLIELYRLCDTDLLPFKNTPDLHKILIIWFGSQELRDLWSNINCHNFDYEDFHALLADCQAIITEKKRNQVNVIINYIKRKLIEFDLNFQCADLTNAEIRERLESIPANVKTLNLDLNNFLYKTNLQLIELFFMLPIRISLVEEERSFCINSYFTEYLISQVLDVIEQDENTLDFNLIEYPINIDETNLSFLISILEQQNHALAYLTSALLLTGDIKNSLTQQRNEQEMAAYFEKRIHDAINLFDKASNEIQLKPIIEYLLWKIKTLTDCSSIKSRLNAYDVTPSYLVSNYSFFTIADPIVMPLINNRVYNIAADTPKCL